MSSGDVTRLEGLEEYLRKTNKKLTNCECKDYVIKYTHLYTKSVHLLIDDEYSSNSVTVSHVTQIGPMGRQPWWKLCWTWKMAITKQWSTCWVLQKEWDIWISYWMRHTQMITMKVWNFELILLISETYVHTFLRTLYVHHYYTIRYSFLLKKLHYLNSMQSEVVSWYIVLRSFANLPRNYTVKPIKCFYMGGLSVAWNYIIRRLGVIFLHVGKILPRWVVT